MVRILGIDPGTATVGWAILDTESSTFSSPGYGHITTSPKLPQSHRLFEIAQDLETIISRFHPQEASVETLFFFKNDKTAITVSQARGAILLTLEKMGITIAEYTPLQVKQALTGYGRAEKEQVQIMVKGMLNLATIPKPDDTADALALAICHAHSRKFESL